MIGSATLSLNLAVFETGFGAQDDFGDRVGEIRRLGLEAGVTLDY